MPSVDELFDQMEEQGIETYEEVQCVIDTDTRTITVPQEYMLLGVENDKKVERMYFKCPKIVGDNIDLSTGFQLFISFVNAGNEADAYHVDDMQVEGENIMFSWLLGEAVTRYQGNVQFAFCAIKPGEEGEPDLNRWNTTINNECICLVGLDSTEIVAEQNADIIAQLWNEIKSLEQEEQNSVKVFQNAGFHNSIFRGKNLGTSFTSAMSTAIQNGSFDDLYVGDYLTINGTVYRVAGFNLIKNCGDNVSIGNNMCLVPDAALYNAQMHNTDSGEYESGSVANDTTGAYANSDMRTTNLTQATNKIITDFGSSHVISYRDILPNATADGQASGWAWYDCKVELMSEVMVYGTKVWGNIGYEVGCLNEQFPLFRLNPESIHRRFSYWLRSVGSVASFARVDAAGGASNSYASGSFGVRPFFFVN